MNCIEALSQHLKKCQPCKLNSFIIEFEELPDEEKVNFDYYDKNEHFLIHCKACEVYKIFPDPAGEINHILLLTK